MRLRIYLVEDNIVIRDNLSEALEELSGARVVGSARTEAEASQWLKTHTAGWDLLVVDLFLLQGNGLGILQMCKERSLRQKVVVLSNYATPAMRERCLLLGADAVFDKSNELEEFARYAAHAVERVGGDTDFQ